MEESPKPGDNSEHDEILFQYDKLRQEILHNETLSLQLLGATLFLVSAAIGFAVREKANDLLRIFIFLGAIFILFISMYQTIDRMRSTFLIASYLRIFVEGKTKHIKWETRLKEFRKKKPSEGYNPFSSLLTTYIIIALANLILVVYYTSTQPDEYKHSATLIAIISFLIWLVMLGVAHNLYTKYVIKNNEFEETWQEVRTEEETDNRKFL